MNVAKLKSVEIIGQAEKRATEIIEEAKKTAKNEGERILTGAKSEITQEINRAKEALRSDVALLAISAAEKILQKEINKADHSSMLSKLAQDL